MRKKGFLLVGLVILLFIALSDDISAQTPTFNCCVFSDSCQQIATGTCPSGQTVIGSCTQAFDCDVGCCCKPSDAAVNGIATTRKHCTDVSGIFNPLRGSSASTYISPTALDIQICRGTCGLSSVCSSGARAFCSDGITELAVCSNGQWVPTGMCPGGAPVTPPAGGPPACTPTKSEETQCTDNIDNDCNGKIDCEDPNCCSDISCIGTPPCVALSCGNSVVDAGEQCDFGSNNGKGLGCSNSCRNEYCGDGTVQIGRDEECDLGTKNGASGSICSADCTLVGGAVSAGRTQCNDGIDNDNNGCPDFPFDTGCSIADGGEADSLEIGGYCTNCSDGTKQTPNSAWFNEQCDIGAPNPDSGCGPGGKCSQECTCSYQCLEQPGSAEFFEVTPVRGDFAVELRWNIDPAASCNLKNVQIKKCSIDPSVSIACNPRDIVANVSSPSVFYYYKDTAVDAKTNYCYKISPYYGSSGAIDEPDADIKCIETGDFDCLSTSGEFCKDNVRYQCDEYNSIKAAIKNCSTMGPRPTDYFCSGPDAAGATRCVYQSSCQSCNDLFGLFGVVGEASYYEAGWTGPAAIHCSYIPTCYNDTTNTAVNKYKECSGIRDCYDYDSMSACEENKCSLGNCGWVGSEGAFSEFGIGVCRPADRSRYNCSLCDVKAASGNLFYGDCDVDVCKLYGDCYYSYGKCRSRDESSCWAYATEEDCIGSGTNQKNVSVNTQWNETFSNKINGDNRILHNSSDYFNYGLCKWMGYAGIVADVPDVFCAKDADNNSMADCDYTNMPCQIDSTPPTTNLVLKGHPYEGNRLLLPKNIDIPVSVEKGAITYFCLAPGNSYCYPNETSTCGIITTFHGPASERGEYTLYYFSEDKSHNLERVKGVPVYIDSAYPKIGSSGSGLMPGGSGNDYKIVLSSPEYLACSGHLEKGNGVPTMPNSVINFEINTEFERDFLNLEDDKYYFVSRCSDKAGNLIENKTWFSIDTNRIHSPEPYGPINHTSVTISVTTNDDAECRYKRFSGVDSRFDEMYKFENTGLASHSSLLTGLQPNDYYEYLVKCRFNDGTIEGNTNDRIRFAIDRTGPVVYPVSTFQAYRFDTSLVWGKDQHIFLQCDDNYFRDTKKIMNMDFGCKNLNYKLQAGGAYTPLPLDANGLGETQIEIAGPGDHPIYYKAEDNADLNANGDGNANERVLIFSIDDQPPEFTIDLYQYPMGTASKPMESISYGNYIVKVTSTKSLSDINMSLTIKGVDMTLTKLYSENFNKAYYFMLYVPYAEEGGLAENQNYDGTLYVTGLVTMPGSVCSLDEISDTDLVKTDGKPIKIDTRLPDIKIEPLISNYNNLGYPLSGKKGSIYYTNESRLFISGYRTNTATDEVLFFVMNGADIATDLANPQKIYDFSENGGVSSLLAQPIKAAYNAEAGSDVLYIQNPNSLLTVGKFIRIKNKERASYGHYKEYYRIAAISYSRANTNTGKGVVNVGTLRISPALEKDVAGNDEIELYAGKYPHTWFGRYVDLEPGNNTIQIRPMSASGTLPSSTTESFTVFSDPYPPEVISQTPKEGTTNQMLTAISIVVREGASESLLDTKTVKLTLNEQDEPVNITSKQMGNYMYYYISYVPKEPLQDGTYNVVFEGQDYSGHALEETDQASPSWTFTIDTKAPSMPEFEVIRGTLWPKPDGIWYIDGSPRFILTFTDSDPVNITAIYKNRAGAGFNLKTNCIGTSSSPLNVFTCEFNPPLIPFISQIGGNTIIDDKFDLIVQAYKTLKSGEKSTTGLYHLAPVVVDTLTPDIVAMQHPGRVKVDGDVVFVAYVNNEAHDLNATLLFKDQWYQLEQTGKIGNNIYKFRWRTPYYDISTIPDKEWDSSILFRAADYAGHHDDYNDSIVIDFRIPEIEKMQIDVMPTVPYGQELVTRYTTVIINGTFVDNDIKSIYIIPGNYIPNRREFDNVTSASINKAKKYFEIKMQINGTINETTLNTLNVFMVDEAGYEVYKSLAVLADLQPPTVIQSLIT